MLRIPQWLCFDAFCRVGLIAPPRRGESVADRSWGVHQTRYHHWHIQMFSRDHSIRRGGQIAHNLRTRFAR
jgi:hypothetical protein